MDRLEPLKRAVISISNAFLVITIGNISNALRKLMIFLGEDVTGNRYWASSNNASPLIKGGSITAWERKEGRETLWLGLY